MKVGQLNQKFKKDLRGRKFIRDAKGVDLDLTEDEIFMISFFLKMKSIPNSKLPTICYLSRRRFIDFIGWDNPEYSDVIVCSTHRIRNTFMG